MKAAGGAAMSARGLWGFALALALLGTGCHGGGEAAKGGQDSKTSGSGGSGGSSKTSGQDKGSNGSDTSGQSQGDAAVPVGTVRIEPADQGRAGIRIAPAMMRQVPQTLRVAGQVVMDEGLTEHLGARADGVVERVSVLPGDTVRAGQTLAQLHTHAVHETAGALQQAFAAEERQGSAVRFAEINRDRYSKLLALQVASQEEAQRAEQELRQAQQALQDAQASVRMEREHLSELLDVAPDSLTRATVYTQELVPIRAVRGGTVMQREATPGQVMVAGAEMFVVSDLQTVWVTAAVNETELARVHRGERAEVETQGYPGVRFAGVVAMVGGELDPQTRTVPVRLRIPNPGIRLRPGMFVTASLAEPATRPAVFVPEGALQDVNGLEVVFVTKDGTNFEVRAVKTGTRAGGMAEVLEGLGAGERVVVDGAFSVKGALLKGSVGEG